eukprot:scaffold11962_cov52-Phaeocystis_antarctica.AAC.2
MRSSSSRLDLRAASRSASLGSADPPRVAGGANAGASTRKVLDGAGAGRLRGGAKDGASGRRRLAASWLG